ncbi:MULTISPECIES: cytochrome d ubiquinol oxidase subunit II [Marichromatium]|uniref:Cytochrome bd-I ubiquinol oxidase subunit 2 apoprotein n=1 Tax=Marichromatium gracile TaxID=1048 RepID=A0A4R4AD80_MARGR|nr:MULTISPECIES: cytochrome d ubiquinol oxidase subunit II [Marichromatium]MBK1709406.1 cytochrome d ubiquinol oxidase subunit II [Marichromatium gracile]RNE91522.1 cytochrome d ubiquinol oxidase subunit II [Marichromatium sp. AB31]RNE92524.1 cytochrome d ubiquinol oxidase subunit II [Marichromatium sp. AB32]TCW37007.1 cytochrome bd-I ubiquinol oxidase subunit 2 apoprotein [Marichromatium gracile]
MILDYEVLKFIWWVLVGVLFIGFAVTDGMDMGVGALLPFLGKNDSERRVIINTVGPHWDGNQVWLITAGGAIFAAWPLVYATAFSGFYFAMLLALFALFFRPVGFDYRSKIANPHWRNAWDWGLFIGGAVPALVFGIAFGNLLQGVPFHLDNLLRPYYTGSFFGLLNPFALLAGLVSLGMLVMHGAVWLQLRTAEPIAGRAKRMVKLAGLFTIIAFALAGLWLTLGVDGYRVSAMPALDATPNPLTKDVEIVPYAWLANYGAHPWTLAFPVLGFAGLGLAVLLSLRDRPGLGLVASSLGLTGIIVTAGAAMFPFIMPSSTNPDSSLIVWDAVSSHLTLTVMFWAAVIFVPLILMYTTWTYAKMWRRVTVEEIEAQDHLAY